MKSDATTPLNLRSAECELATVAGGKAATLSKLLRLGFPIPDGFVLTHDLASAICQERVDPETAARINAYICKLQAQDTSRTIILRSSATVEDHRDHLFPGIFDSVRNIRSWETFLAGLQEVVQSKSSELALRYSQIHSIPWRTIQMPVLVQSEVKALFSGVCTPISSEEVGVTDAFIEVERGANSDLLHGRSIGQSYIVRHDARIVRLTPIPPDLPEAPPNILREVRALTNEISTVLGYAAETEWVFDGRKLYIVQARPSPNRPTSFGRPDAPQAQVLPNEQIYGLKGAAMLWFRDNQLFTCPLVVLEPGGEAANFKDILEETNFGSEGLTVRFSYGNELGLPRMFVSGAEQAFDAILRLRDPRWLTIVHSYIDVRRSFEIYIDATSLVLEHVPGVWESDNVLQPDFIKVEASETVIRAAREERLAVFHSPTGRRTGNVKPVADRVLARWQSRLRRIGNLIREEFEDHLPLNLHSVEDKFGNWQFLNLRRTASLPMFGQIPHNLWIVRSRTDVVNWNGTDPVLVQAAVNRGREYELVELAKDLPSTVYIDFGWLSHPAMVLREAGINVIPVY